MTTAAFITTMVVLVAMSLAFQYLVVTVLGNRLDDLGRRLGDVDGRLTSAEAGLRDIAPRLSTLSTHAGR